MNIWLCNPFDNLVEEGARPQRYALLAAEFARRGHAVTWWTSDFSHARKARRAAADGTPLPHAYANAQGVFMRLVATPPYARNVSLRRVRSHRAFARGIPDPGLYTPSSQARLLTQGTSQHRGTGVSCSNTGGRGFRARQSSRAQTPVHLCSSPH